MVLNELKRIFETDRDPLGQSLSTLGFAIGLSGNDAKTDSPPATQSQQFIRDSVFAIAKPSFTKDQILAGLKVSNPKAAESELSKVEKICLIFSKTFRNAIQNASTNDAFKDFGKSSKITNFGDVGAWSAFWDANPATPSVTATEITTLAQSHLNDSSYSNELFNSLFVRDKPQNFGKTKAKGLIDHLVANPASVGDAVLTADSVLYIVHRTMENAADLKKIVAAK